MQDINRYKPKSNTEAIEVLNPNVEAFPNQEMPTIVWE
jgi:hypothetical protein